ncbi:MAG: T9SS type A sorting domain-containing protein [Ignavibacteriae bacterium]|nr:T9SS type A sorting domain-containing protein [Ignavibacteriota bacterium]MCB9242519.1 T9SS type A sorting domain-containing protein [Ignavibacteriales bacterium]
MKTKIIQISFVVFFISGFVFSVNENSSGSKINNDNSINTVSSPAHTELTVYVSSIPDKNIRVWTCPIIGGEFTECAFQEEGVYTVGSIANGLYKIVACCDDYIGCDTINIYGPNLKFESYISLTSASGLECDSLCPCALVCDVSSSGPDENSLKLESDLSLESFELYQNYPNPFNPSTRIRFTIPTAGYTSLKIYDSMGREIATLISGNLKSGNFNLEFNGENLPSGVYYYKLISSNYSSIKKMILLK